MSTAKDTEAEVIKAAEQCRTYDLPGIGGSETRLALWESANDPGNRRLWDSSKVRIEGMQHAAKRYLAVSHCILSTEMLFRSRNVSFSSQSISVLHAGADGTRFAATRLDLAGSFIYFKTLLAGHFHDADLSAHSLNTISSAVLRQVLRALYAGKVC